MEKGQRRKEPLCSLNKIRRKCKLKQLLASNKKKGHDRAAGRGLRARLESS